MNGAELPTKINPQHMVKPRLDVYYPSVAGLANLEAQQRINNALRGLNDRIIAEQGYYQNPKTEVTGYYEVKTNERDILSISLVNDAYSGGVHGLRIIRSLTMDTKTGRIYRLKDLFKENADYVKRLSDIIRRQIKERNIYLLGPFTGIRPDQDFYIADKSLVIYFQLYELTSYASGFPYFPISIYEIEDIIDEKGPLKLLTY